MHLDDPDATAPTITIIIETRETVPAEDAGAILEEVARGFYRHVRGTAQRQLRLGVRRIAAGSLVIEFVVTGPEVRAASGNDRRDAARGFVEMLRSLILTAGTSPTHTRRGAGDRLVNALLAPVSGGYAESLTAAAGGETASVLVDRSVVAGIAAAREDADRRPLSLPAPDAPGAAAIAADPGSAPSLLTLEGKQGTVFDVKGNWYVRLEGEEGVLNPLRLALNVTVEDEGTYLFDGIWERRRYHIRAARRIG